MSEYVITTDATADMPEAFYKESKIPQIPMPYSIDNVEYGSGPNNLTFEQFYQKLRGGAMPVTSQVKQYDAMLCFEEILKAGKDVLHISFSSAMSGSFDNLSIVRKELIAKYPERRLILIDSLCGAGGEGLMVYYANKEKTAGATIEELADWCERKKLTFQHLFIVEDMANLRRSGRLSLIEASIATILKIKPVLELNAAGRIMPVDKCIGRKKAISCMLAKMRANINYGANDFVMVGHGDSIEEAKKLGEQIKAEFGIKEVLYTHVNTLVGSHAGPGALALYYVGNKRHNN